jgi:hypothetical protein
MDWRNQGLGAVASRWLHPTNYALHFDNDPRIKTDKPPATMNVATLSRTTIAAIVIALAGVSLAGLLWLARRPARVLSLWQLRVEWALFLLAMVWLMPVLRRYHLILLLPALAVLASGIHYAGPQRRWSKLTQLAIGGLLVCQLAVLTRELPESGILRWFEGVLGADSVAALSSALDAGIVEAAGVLLLPVVVLAVPMIALLLRLARAPASVPGHAYAPPHPARAHQSVGGPAAGGANAVAART